MSIRNKRIQSPVKKNIKFRGAKSDNGEAGVFYYYDSETKKNIDIPLPITFIDVSSYGTIVGWSDEKQAGIYSNEVIDNKTPFTVKYSKKGIMCTGLYKDIKDMVKANGGKYAMAVYAIMNKEIVKFVLQGKAMSMWLEKNPGDFITVRETLDGAKGATKFKMPVFEARELTQEETDTISAGYPQIFAYLDERDSKPVTDDGEESEMEQIVHDDIPVVENQVSAFEELTAGDLDMKIEEFKRQQEDDTDELLSKVPF